MLKHMKDPHGPIIVKSLSIKIEEMWMLWLAVLLHKSGNSLVVATIMTWPVQSGARATAVSKLDDKHC